MSDDEGDADREGTAVVDPDRASTERHTDPDGSAPTNEEATEKRPNAIDSVSHSGGAATRQGEDPDTDTDGDESGEPATSVSHDAFLDALQAEGRPVATAQQVARRTDTTQSVATDGLERLAADGRVERMAVETDPVVWYPREWGKLADRERIVLFPERRQLVVDQPTQFTRARLTQFAHLVDTSGEGGYLYEIRAEDVWNAPFDTLPELLARVRATLPRRSPALEEFIEGQWRRAHQFRLFTHEDGYTVLEAESESLMGNVARQKLDESHLHAPISDTESWVRDEAVAAVKRILYEAGYPVVDDRDLESGDPLDVELTVDLREYQQEWRDAFLERKAGVVVGPPGSGKTVTALGVLAALGGETLILVPSRELAAQWREALFEHTTLTSTEVGEYHGGTKEIRPVTIATYQTAGMDRHRSLFDSREWGLIVYDEVQHIPAPVHRRSADLQSKARLGLSATPVREDDREKEIFTLVGPPIGTDWSALFEAGYVQEPEVEIRYVPWADDMAGNEYAAADGRDKHRIAAENEAKVAEVQHLLDQHGDAKALVFVDWLDQGETMAAALDVPFISGETPHHERERLFREFRDGDRRTIVISRVGDEGIDLPDAELAVVASGLGGSRRQGAQRAGRTMRPAGSALVYVLATRGTVEEEFAQRQMRHLAEKGVRVREADLGGSGN
jgi:DNA excision repair protein ERCC-3